MTHALEVVAKPMKISQRFRGTPFFGKKVFPGPFPKKIILFGPLQITILLRALSSKIEKHMHKCSSTFPGSDDQKPNKAFYNQHVLDGETSTKEPLNSPNEYCNRF